MREALRCQSIGAAVALVCTAVWGAAEVPLPVSPGSEDQILAIGGRCPTFSWISPSGARSLELVVYRLPDQGSSAEGVEGKPVIRKVLPGEARSWTPALDQCLEPGARYAWSLLSVDGRGAPRWSPPSLFRIQAVTTEEVEKALGVLRTYLDQEMETTAARDGFPKALAVGPEEPGPQPEPRPEPAFSQPGEIALEAGASPTLPAGLKTALVAEEADTAMATLGVGGVSHSPIEGSAGVWGESLALLAGKVAGVKGTASSGEGWGGYFQNYWWAGTGVFAGAGPKADSPSGQILGADLVLGAAIDPFTLEVDDEGTIFSDPMYPSSDLILFSNDEVRVHLNLDGDTESDGSWFKIFNGLTNIFEIDQSGDTHVTGGLTVDGTVGGSLVDEYEVDDAVKAAVAWHETRHHRKRVFVTSSTWNGNLGGLGGADAKCRALAANVGLSGIFQAWLGTQYTSAASRFTTTKSINGAYVLVDGTKIADNWDDLVSCNGTCIYHTIDMDETGTRLNAATDNTNVWTGAHYDGSSPSYLGPDNARWCSSWSSGGTGIGGWRGLWTMTDVRWTGKAGLGNQTCNFEAHLYCFEY